MANQLFCGDCLTVLDKIADETVDLIYIDPPFFSQRRHGQAGGFEDRWQGGIQAYLDYLLPRMRKLRAKLKPTGTAYIHLDWHSVHYVKVEADRIFGYERFLNEIIWCYNVGGKSGRQWGRKHDTILFYAKGEDWYFDGRAAGISRDTGAKSFGGIIATDAGGRKYQDKLAKSSGRYYRYYLDEPKIAEDWWTGINSIQSQSAERLGWPTQKPLALLERIVKSSSPPEGTVLDAFCGCGTALAAAQSCGRSWIGIDISPAAIRTAAERLRAMAATWQSHDVS